jgi:hypothetical protein
MPEDVRERTTSTWKTVCVVGDQLKNDRGLLDALETCPLEVVFVG